ncbi:MAG: SagB family peptide dehydrogenase [Candidatus Thiodiazotropha sp. (ex Monitilora ramsayi)]|nr:SagB family peptide dehydrogenase [Candidatus Thiodiazotropha sp. (ex Monitilora ramsayi)]
MNTRSAAGIECVRNYHQRTKHHLDRYADGPGFLDWDQQPDPFRRFGGSPLFLLPLTFDHLPDPTLGELERQLSYKPLQNWGLTEISSLLRHSLGLSAWKAYGPDRWALRCNPSSGNLHPTEGYLIIKGLPKLKSGVYHYAPHEHALELRAAFKPDSESIMAPTAEILLGLSSIPWREAWKYGERAFRYVHLDLGHAIGALDYAAATLGYRLEPVSTNWQQLTRLMGFDRDQDFANTEREHPDLLLRLTSDTAADMPSPLSWWLIQAEAADWQGQANRLSKHPRHHWPIIDEVSDAIAHSEGKSKISHGENDFPSKMATSDIPARQLILQRRSAQAFSGQRSLPKRDFICLLDSLLPRQTAVPWRAWPYLAQIHLVLFVHRVDEITPGLYLFPRRPEILETLTGEMDRQFSFEKPEEIPHHLPLYRLTIADTQQAARIISCHQDIAADSFFSLGMLAEFDNALETQGAGGYPGLYWEAGLIGQALYIHSESLGVRGTGIGCFFDDLVHELLGLSTTRFQSLYHFTVGEPKDDTRLQTLPPYSHLSRS